MPFFNFPGIGVVHVRMSKTPRRREKFMGLRWPATRKELYAAGYERALTIPPRPCKCCGKTIHFWRTPDKALMPVEISAENDNELLCHFNTCPHADEFRRAAATKPKQRELFS
jgi:hypothetical protein